MRRSKKTEKTLQSVQRLAVGAQSLAGVGVDIVEIERIEKVIARTPRILQRIFSEGEREYAESKAKPAVHYALFFAAKEAVLKALGTGFAGMNFTDVEVGHDRLGKPLVVLHGHAQEVADEQDVIDVQLSLSYTHKVGVASAVAIKEEHRPPKPENNNPQEELARQFKEMRSLLDDMDVRLKELKEAEPFLRDEKQDKDSEASLSSVNEPFSSTDELEKNQLGFGDALDALREPDDNLTDREALSEDPESSSDST